MQNCQFWKFFQWKTLLLGTFFTLTIWSGGLHFLKHQDFHSARLSEVESLLWEILYTPKLQIIPRNCKIVGFDFASKLSNFSLHQFPKIPDLSPDEKPRNIWQVCFANNIISVTFPSSILDCWRNSPKQILSSPPPFHSAPFFRIDISTFLSDMVEWGTSCRMQWFYSKHDWY